MTVEYIHRFITSLLFTTATETAVLVFLLLYVFRKQYAMREMLFAGFYASFSTIPYVWFVFPYITDWSRNASLMVSEPAVFLIDAFVYTRILKLDWRTALIVSFLCNLASYVIGPLLRNNGLWIYW